MGAAKTANRFMRLRGSTHVLCIVPGCKLLKIKGACMLARGRFANVRWALRAQLICKLLVLKDFSNAFSRSGSA